MVGLGYCPALPCLVHAEAPAPAVVPRGKQSPHDDRFHHGRASPHGRLQMRAWDYRIIACRTLEYMYRPAKRIVTQWQSFLHS